MNALQWGNYHGKVGYGVPKFCHVKSYLKKRSDIVIDQKFRNYTKKDRFMTFPEVPIYHFELLHTRHVLTQVSIELKFSLLKEGLCLFRRVYNPAYI